MTTLSTQNLTKRFGRIVANDGIDYEVETGTLSGVIGPNGAGKTTFINCITGRLQPDDGVVLFEDEDITDLPEHKRVARGLALAEQLISTYDDLTVFDNVATALDLSRDDRLYDNIFRTTKYQLEEERIEEKVFDILDTIDLEETAFEPTENLPYGRKKRLMIGMAIATDPDILILDEPVAGLNPEESVAMMDIIRSLVKDEDLGAVIIEHDMDIIMNYCDEIMVLANGTVLAKGTATEIQENEQVKEVYLG